MFNEQRENMKASLMHVLHIKHTLLTKRDSQTKTYVTTNSKCDMICDIIVHNSSYYVDTLAH